MTRYKIIRYFQNEKQPKEIIRTGLTLAQAQSHCNSPETASATATSKYSKLITAEKGPWFDGYAEEN